ncbi:hypothetical protein FRC04_007594 [Tulasnella sp. 424]|nr:hypothetical protein FRC04_007594 [Tulasnella sp. 424]
MDASSQQLFNQIAANQDERRTNSISNVFESYEGGGDPPFEQLNRSTLFADQVHAGQQPRSQLANPLPWQHSSQPRQYATVPAIGMMRPSSWAPRTSRIVPYVASDSRSPLQGNAQPLSRDDPAYQQWINSLWQPFDLGPFRPAPPTILDSPPQFLQGGLIMQSPSMSDVSDPTSQHSPEYDSPPSLPISPLMERRGSGPDRNQPSSSRSSAPTPYSRCRCPKNGGKPSRHWRTACPYNPNRTEARSFECNICGQKFNRKDNLTRHLRNRHNAEPDPEGPTP